MTNDKLKAAVREAIYGADANWTEPTVDCITKALAQRGVVVQAEYKALRQFVEALALGDQRALSDVRGIALGLVSGLPPQTPPAPVFEVGKTYKMVDQTINGKFTPGRTFRVDEIVQDGLAAKGALNGEEGWTYSLSCFIPGAIEDEPRDPVFEVDGLHEAEMRCVATMVRKRTLRDVSSIISGSHNVHRIYNEIRKLIEAEEAEPSTTVAEDMYVRANRQSMERFEADNKQPSPTAIPDEPALTPLTYEQACALPVGAEVVCLDRGKYEVIIEPGVKYKVTRERALAPTRQKYQRAALR